MVPSQGSKQQQQQQARVEEQTEPLGKMLRWSLRMMGDQRKENAEEVTVEKKKKKME